MKAEMDEALAVWCLAGRGGRSAAKDRARDVAALLRPTQLQVRRMELEHWSF